jgi:hypothetical protein
MPMNMLSTKAQQNKRRIEQRGILLGDKQMQVDKQAKGMETILTIKPLSQKVGVTQSPIDKYLLLQVIEVFKEPKQELLKNE